MTRSIVLSVALTALLAACPGDPENQAPVVDAGADVEVVLGESARLAATATDPDGDALTLAWTITEQPAGSSVQLTGADRAALTFTPDVEGSYTLTLSASDGTLEATDTVQVTATPPPFISGSVAVTVVDFDTGDPISGAAVDVSGLSGTTGADGSVLIEDASLEGAQLLTVTSPETVSVDHDLDPATAAVDRPRWRGVTVHGAIRSEITVPLRKSGAAREADARGVVRGQIDFDLFDRLPAVEPFLSLSTDELTSGQIRAVLIAPMVPGDTSALSVRDLLGRPPAAGATLPGNLTTDDLFLNDPGIATLLGLPTGGPEDPLTHFVVDAPAGLQRFFVLGILIDIDTIALVPLLGGSGVVDTAAFFGSMQFTTLFAGTLDLDVPAGGENVLAAPILPADLDSLMPVEAQVNFVDETSGWAFDPSIQVNIRRAVITPTVTATVTAPTELADPRVAAQLPADVEVEITNPDGSPQDPPASQTLDIPADTGPVDTGVPYSLVVAAVEVPEGLMPLGLAFTRVADIARPSAVFPVPTFAGDLVGAPMHGITLTTRGMFPSSRDGAYDLLPGLHTSRVDLSAGGTSAAAAPSAFPDLDGAPDAGLRVRVDVERADTSTTVVDSARAYVVRPYQPVSGVHDLGTELPLSLPAGAGELAHLTMTLRTWTQVDDGSGTLRWVILEDPLWDVYADTAAGGTLGLPALATTPFSSGDEVRIDVRVETFPSPLDMERWSGDRLRLGPAEFTSDGFLLAVP